MDFHDYVPKGEHMNQLAFSETCDETVFIYPYYHLKENMTKMLDQYS